MPLARHAIDGYSSVACQLEENLVTNFHPDIVENSVSPDCEAWLSDIIYVLSPGPFDL